MSSTPLGDVAISRLTPWLRTVVPFAWSALIAWLVGLGAIPASVSTWADGLGAQIATVLIAAVVYPAIRWLEPRMPDALTRLFIGSIQQPIYVDPENIIPARVDLSTVSHAIENEPVSDGEPDLTDAIDPTRDVSQLDRWDGVGRHAEPPAT